MARRLLRSSDPADATASTPESAADAATPGRRRALAHLPFALLVCAGVLLRLATQLGFRPAFAWPDSVDYLRTARTLVPDTLRPSGYALFLRLVPHWQQLWPVTLVQHVIGVALAVLLYALLLRRRVPAWGAALATAPVLVDPWQVTLEHQVLSDVLFEALVLAACVLLVWRRRVGVATTACAGVLLGAATTVRSVGIILFVPAALAVLLGQARWRPALALVAAFVVPIGSYTIWYHAAHGAYSLSDAQYKQVYGRVATYVDCTGLTMPAYERPLCPVRTSGARPGPGYFVWNRHSPLARFSPPPGKTLNGVLKDFERRAITHQPVAYAGTVAFDIARGFWPTRFRDAYGVMKPHLDSHVARTYSVQLRTSPRLTEPLRSYGRHFFFPGPLLAGCLLAGFAAAAGLGRARRSGLRSAAGLFAGTLLGLVVLSAAAVQFSWRYQLPQLVLLPPAAAFGLVGMLRRTPDPDALDGREVALRLTARLPMPAALRDALLGEHRKRMGRYFLGSVICTVISTVTFLVAFGFGLLGSRGASLASSATGAVAGYYLNRNWAWGRRGRADVRRELVPYWATIVATAAAAAVVTGVVNSAVRGITTHHGVRTLFDAAAFLGTYLVSFVVKYVVFNRLFAGSRGGHDDSPAAAPPEVSTDGERSSAEVEVDSGHP